MEIRITSSKPVKYCYSISRGDFNHLDVDHTILAVRHHLHHLQTRSRYVQDVLAEIALSRPLNLVELRPGNFDKELALDARNGVHGRLDVMNGDVLDQELRPDGVDDISVSMP